jgi:ferredoxin-fold anticodon binding domain-containing protein
MLGKPSMQRRNKKAAIELGMKVSVRRSSRSHIGVVTRVEDDYVFVRWTNSDFAETAEYQAHRDDVTPLAGWF